MKPTSFGQDSVHSSTRPCHGLGDGSSTAQFFYTWISSSNHRWNIHAQAMQPQCIYSQPLKQKDGFFVDRHAARQRCLKSERFCSLKKNVGRLGHKLLIEVCRCLTVRLFHWVDPLMTLTPLHARSWSHWDFFYRRLVFSISDVSFKVKVELLASERSWSLTVEVGQLGRSSRTCKDEMLT